jgi:hypothetical protein
MVKIVKQNKLRQNERMLPKWIRILALGLCSAVTIGAIAHFSLPFPTTASPKQESAESQGSTESQRSAEISDEWRQATDAEEENQWHYILNSPLGIAALNQLAIEGFINPRCSKTFYINEQYGGFQSLMQVECPEPQGASIAVGYDEVHVIFNRFEDNIEGFEIQRFGQS